MSVLTARRGGVNEVLPERLYQRGNFLSWPHERKHEMLSELGISVVVNLWHKVDPDLARDETGTIYLNWHISPTEAPDDADAVAGMLVALMRSGNRLLVHCEAGRGRSVWLCAELVARYLGIPRPEAYERVLQACPQASVSPVLRRRLGVAA